MPTATVLVDMCVFVWSTPLLIIDKGCLIAQLLLNGVPHIRVVRSVPREDIGNLCRLFLHQRLIEVWGHGPRHIAHSHPDVNQEDRRKLLRANVPQHRDTGPPAAGEEIEDLRGRGEPLLNYLVRERVESFLPFNVMVVGDEDVKLVLQIVHEVPHVVATGSAIHDRAAKHDQQRGTLERAAFVRCDPKLSKACNLDKTTHFEPPFSRSILWAPFSGSKISARPAELRLRPVPTRIDP